MMRITPAPMYENDNEQLKGDTEPGDMCQATGARRQVPGDRSRRQVPGDRCQATGANSILCQFNSVQFNSVQFGSVQFNAVQFNSIQFSPLQFNLL